MPEQIRHPFPSANRSNQGPTVEGLPVQPCALAERRPEVGGLFEGGQKQVQNAERRLQQVRNLNHFVISTLKLSLSLSLKTI